MLGRIMRSRTLARTAIIGLTLGLAALAGLALSGAVIIGRSSAHTRQINDVSARWTKVFDLVTVEDEARVHFMRASTATGREPMRSGLGSADSDLAWLRTSAGPADSDAAVGVQETYDAYIQTLRGMVNRQESGDTDQVALDNDQAVLVISSLRKQLIADIVRKQRELASYMTTMDRKSHTLRTAATAISSVDLVFLGFCSVFLLRYQRHTERQAVASRHQAHHDSLTGIANRVLLEERMRDALDGAGRAEGHAALLLLDLNRFKEINDTLGHHHGDLLLQQVAIRLNTVIRDRDTVARLGGDEFAVLLPGISSETDATAVAERALKALRVQADLEGVIVDVSASIGVAVYPQHGDTASELLQHADVAMYIAKRGHLGYACYDPDTDENSSDQLTMLSELRRAIDNNELVLHYQPQVRANSGEVCGAEALVRWEHPRRGFLGPGEFIPLAEQSDLIQPLTEYILAASLRQHRQWRDAGVLIPVAVNVAARCLLDQNFPDRVDELLHEYHIPPAELTLEITESAVISDPQQAKEILSRLRDLGVRLSVDDFGTGYSSMAYLQTLPLHELKIDRCFIKEISSATSNDAAIVLAIVELAHALNLEVVAEGVEDEATLTALARMGCDIGQGYHMCRPLPADKLGAWLDQHPERLPVRHPASVAPA
jgi:diguanylate cyclase (GGDEF)-like protein